MNKNNNSMKNDELIKEIPNLTDTELDNLIKDEMRRRGFTTFINYQGEEESL